MAQIHRHLATTRHCEMQTAWIIPGMYCTLRVICFNKLFVLLYELWKFNQLSICSNSFLFICVIHLATWVTGNTTHNELCIIILTIKLPYFVAHNAQLYSFININFIVLVSERFLHNQYLVDWYLFISISQSIYNQTSNISRILVGNRIVDYSDEVGASPIGAAPTTSSFST